MTAVEHTIADAGSTPIDEPAGSTGSAIPPEPPDRRRGHAIWSELRGDRMAMCGVVVLLTLVLVAVFAPLVAPHDPTAQSLTGRLQPPAWTSGGDWTHVLGTDGLGRDVLSRLIFGARTTLLVGAAVVVIAGGFGVSLGVIAGYRGGRLDVVIMRVVDTQFAFPGLLLAITIISAVGASLRSLVLVLSLGAWMVFARMARGATLSVSQSTYVEAAETVGCRPRRVVLRHVLPNLATPLLTLAVLEFAVIVLAEAGLSFLGLGVQAPQTSWGLDVATGRDYIFNAWWLVTFPGLAISMTVLATNLVAGWLRVVADPQERDKRFSAATTASSM